MVLLEETRTLTILSSGHQNSIVDKFMGALDKNNKCYLVQNVINIQNSRQKVRGQKEVFVITDQKPEKSQKMK